MAAGTQIYPDMTPNVSLPSGSWVPFVDQAAESSNQRYDLGTDLLTRVSYAALAAESGAALVGSIGPSTVQADLDARPTSAALAASGGSALVGFLQAGSGAVLRTVQSKLRDHLCVKDYGAVGNGVADDTASIAACYSAARALGVGEVFFPSGDYLTSAMIDASLVATIGEGFETTRILATAAITAILDVNDQNSRVANIFLDGNQNLGRVAQHGIRMEGTNGTEIENVRIAATSLDGIYFAVAGNNNNVKIVNCLIRNCGTSYGTGDSTNGAGGTTATIAGAADLTTLGIRVGFDYIKIDTEAVRLITAVTATTVSFFPSIASAHNNVDYAILQGSCVGIPAHGDNSAIKIFGSTLQDAEVAGVHDQGLYGAICDGNVVEGCEVGRIIGKRFPGDDTRNIGAVDIGCYYEFCDNNYQLEFWQALQISNPTFGDSGLVNWWDKVRVVDNAGSTSQFAINGQSVIGPKATITNAATIDPNWGQTIVVRQSSGATDITVNLPSVTAGTGSAYIYQNYAVPITFVFNDIGGKTVTFKAASINVNGVAGATGAAFTGNYKRLVCTYDSANGWTVA